VPSSIATVACLLFTIAVLDGQAAEYRQNAADVASRTDNKQRHNLVLPTDADRQSANGGNRNGTSHGNGLESDKPKDEAQGPAENKTRREKRQLRWVLVFNTKDGNDYAKQLQALGAILAAPESGSSYRLFRDLTKRPVKGQVEDLTNINRIYWIDDEKKSVEGLSKALGVHPAPAHFVAFFPESLEKELLQKELTFAGRKEEDIGETQFKVVHIVVQKEDRYRVLVIKQKPR
jgi:hypothetical protein